MSQWYVSRRGLVTGPFQEEKLIADIASGKIGPVDLVFTPGDSRWRLVAEVESLRRPGSRGLVSGEWIVALARGKMDGPWSTEDICLRIKAGSLSYSNLVWREGEAGWSRIGDRSEFGGRGAPVVLASNGADADRGEDLLASVVRLERLPQRPSSGMSAEEAALILGFREELPDEADGLDLASAARLLGCAFAVAVSFLFTRASALAGTGAAATVVAPSAVLQIVPLKLASSAPSLVFQTDAKPDEVITVRLKGRSGMVLDYPSYRRVFQVRRSAGEIPTLELGKAGVPVGSYTVEAELRGTKTTKQIFIGRKGVFDAAISAHVKSISVRQQEERKALFYASSWLEGLAGELNSAYRTHRKGNGWKAFYAGWKRRVRASRQPVDELLRSPEEEMAYPDELRSFKGAVDRVERQAVVYDSAIQQKRDLASSETASVSSFSEIKEAAIGFTSRPKLP